MHVRLNGKIKALSDKKALHNSVKDMYRHGLGVKMIELVTKDPPYGKPKLGNSDRKEGIEIIYFHFDLLFYMDFLDFNRIVYSEFHFRLKAKIKRQCHP